MSKPSIEELAHDSYISISEYQYRIHKRVIPDLLKHLLNYHRLQEKCVSEKLFIKVVDAYLEASNTTTDPIYCNKEALAYYESQVQS